MKLYNNLVIIGMIMACLIFLPTAGCFQQQSVNTSDSDVQTETSNSYVIVDTGQDVCFNAFEEIPYPNEGDPFFGQDAQYKRNQPSYQDNDDGTVTDLNTGLMWQQDPGDKITYNTAISNVESFQLAGYSDWRVPTIKELYSLIDFRGTDPSGGASSGLIPFIDTTFFDFEYGDESSGERLIDSQWVTSSVYGSTVMNGQEGFFGVNFADGRIKCYPTSDFKLYFCIYVRGNEYGQNLFVDNGDGTIIDQATGLMWQKGDSGDGMIWEDALVYSENLELAGYSNWRLPNAKELQSIVDYSRCPDITNSAAIDPIFGISTIKNENGDTDYPFFWTSTTHIGHPDQGTNAVYISFGRALGYWMQQWTDVHGAGAQRSDPKTGDPEDYPTGHGPQGDAIRIYNYVRCVRTIDTDNQAPETPDRPSGPDSVNKGIEYTYSTSTIDPEGDQVYYLFDWGDGSQSEWIGPYESDVICNASYIWSSQNTIDIRVKAKDATGAQSDWSDPLSISISKTKQSIILYISEIIELLLEKINLLLHD